MNDSHLDGLTIVEKRLVKNYAILIFSGTYTWELAPDRPVPEKLVPYVKEEILIKFT